MPKKVRALGQHDWDQLLIVAAGFLPLTGGDLKAAMARAIAAHAELVELVRKDGVHARLPRGEVHLFADETGLNLSYETRPPLTASSPPDPGPDLALEVPDRPRR